MGDRSDLVLLGLSTLVSEAQLKEAFHRVALVDHPDRGGDPQVFDEKRQAYQRLLQQIRTPVPCLACMGWGKISIAEGFTIVKTPCTACDGTGEVSNDLDELCDELAQALGEAHAGLLERVRIRLKGG